MPPLHPLDHQALVGHDHAPRHVVAHQGALVESRCQGESEEANSVSGSQGESRGSGRVRVSIMFLNEFRVFCEESRHMHMYIWDDVL